MIFEHPLNERIRTFLRIEHLFDQLQHFLRQQDAPASRVAIMQLLDIATITARADIKNEILKELERHLDILGRLANQPGVDPAALEQILSNLDDAVDDIQSISHPVGQHAREDEFLKAIARRSSLPGGTCSFDLPYFQCWLNQAPELRQAHFAHWLHDLVPAVKAIRLMLSLIRNSASGRPMVAEEGFFQESLNPESPSQMLRISLDAALLVVPEISGHKNRFSIRFMSAQPPEQPVPCSDDIPFKLTCCVF